MNFFQASTRDSRRLSGVVLARTVSVACALMLGCVAVDAVAGTATGRVTSIYIINGTAPSAAGASVLAFTLGNGTTGAPACSDGSWAIDLGSPVGRAMHQQLMHAQQQSATVSVLGDGTCGVWNQPRERALSIQVNF